MSKLIEYSYPIIIHRYSLMTDSGGAGKFRGGSGTCWEVEPIDETMTFVMFGEGRRLPAMGAAKAHSKMIESKVGRVEITRGGEVEIVRKNVIAKIQPGETAANKNPGGGGYGDPFERPVEKVVSDVKNDLVSLAGAREDYGVVISDAVTLDVDTVATQKLRGNRSMPGADYARPTTETKPAPPPRTGAPQHRIEAAGSDRNVTPGTSPPDDAQKHRPLTAADVGHIKIIDFGKLDAERKKRKKDMKIKFF